LFGLGRIWRKFKKNCNLNGCVGFLNYLFFHQTVSKFQKLLSLQKTKCTMATPQPSRGLNEAQLMLLRLFNVGLNDTQISQIRELIISHLEKELFAEINQVVEEKGYTQEDFTAMLNQSQRTKLL
jgi:hypothetical protein